MSGYGKSTMKKSGEVRHHVHDPIVVPEDVLAEHPNLELMPVNPMNQLELMTVDQMADMIMSIDESDMTRRINYFNLACMAIHKHVDCRSVDSMRQGFEALVTLCGLTGMQLLNSAAFYVIGIDNMTAQYWAAGKQGATPERTALVKEIKKVCAMNREAMGAAGKLNPVLTIFWQKNYDGFRDQGYAPTEQNNLLGERQDARQIAEKYRGVIEMDSDD